ncbi:MAG: diguanylate cyclase, partial [Gammaproteobacteria bacterium]|nr:diguanylate cyclase [Gammaproteobacteria bacterium]NIY20782.1 diguanylate cyclase [Gammaproteobacteria bacterium]
MAGVVDVTERNKIEKEVHHLAHYDSLTGQPNRFLLQERLQHALIQAQREDNKVGVLFVDLDRFKWVNDTLGHVYGDQLLQKVAKKMQACVRQGDTVARFGGDEFVIILYGFSCEEEPPHFAQRFLDTLAQPITLDGVEVMNSASIGIAIYPMDGKDVETLLRNADMAMYSAKEHGRNNYQFFSIEMNDKILAKLGLENRLRRAINSNEFYLEYQPQFDLLTRKITGFEALLRWQDPDYGLVSPTEFIPVAEQCGVIYPLGEWVLQTACEQAKILQEQSHDRLRMAVNVSSTQFLRHDFIDMVEDRLSNSGLDPECLEIELTETQVMENLQKGIERLTDLKVRNIKLAIDDFGTGYSSLQY